MATYTIIFHSPDAEPTIWVTSDIPSGFYFGEIQQSNPIRENYNLDGWYYNELLEGDPIISETEITSDLDLYAKWIPDQYNITFDSQGGTDVDPIVVLYGIPIGELPVTILEEFNFIGWSEDGGTTIVKETDTFDIDTTLYAIWEPITYTITFNTQGGDVIDPIVILYSEAIGSLPVSMITGYDFVGWSLSLDDIEIITADYIPTSDITLYAIREIIQYTITFDSQGGNDIDPKVLDYNIEVGSIEVPVRDDYIFLNWNSESDGSGFELESTYIPTSDITVYAIWELITYTITFDSQSGSSVSSIDINSGSPIGDLPISNRVGYDFVGWSLSLDDIEIIKSTYIIESDITLYAIWDKLEFTIIFDSEGGSSVPSIIKEYGDTIGILPTSNKDGYIFDGWYTADGGVGIKISETTLVYKDTTYYAKWRSLESTNGYYNYTIVPLENKCILSFTDEFRDAINRETPIQHLAWLPGNPLPNPSLHSDYEYSLAMDVSNIFSGFNNIIEIDLSEWYLGMMIVYMKTMFDNSTIIMVYISQEYYIDILHYMIKNDNMIYNVKSVPPKPEGSMTNQLLPFNHSLMINRTFQEPDFYLLESIENRNTNGTYIDTGMAILNTKYALELDMKINYIHGAYFCPVGARSISGNNNNSSIIIANDLGHLSFVNYWNKNVIIPLDKMYNEETPLNMVLYDDYYILNDKMYYHAEIGTEGNVTDENMHTYIGAMNNVGTPTVMSNTEYQIFKYKVFSLSNNEFISVGLPIEMKNSSGIFNGDGAMFDIINLEYRPSVGDITYKPGRRIGYGFNDGRIYNMDGSPFIWW